MFLVNNYHKNPLKWLFVGANCKGETQFQFFFHFRSHSGWILIVIHK